MSVWTDTGLCGSNPSSYTESAPEKAQTLMSLLSLRNELDIHVTFMLYCCFRGGNLR